MPFGLSLVVFGIDQLTKSAVVRSMTLGEGRAVAGDFVTFTRTANAGGVWGIEMGPVWLVAALSVLVVCAIGYALFRSRGSSLAVRLALAAVIGGAAGNLSDRVRLGSVVDFVSVGFGDTRWPAFNVADSAIVVGVVVLVLFAGRKREKGAEPGG